jgi:tetratricopeptide (TPR) repeat protein/predicted Ser/Thr protein kinase
MPESRPGDEDRASGVSHGAPAPGVPWGEQSTLQAAPGVGNFDDAGSQWGRRAPDESTPPPAARIGRYSVLRELGRGGMGETYVAYDEELDRKVATKLVRSDLIGEQSQKRLRREAQALARLMHPNIVAVYDVGIHGERPFIAMEFVPGQTLGSWLAAQPRTWAEVLTVFRQVGEGLRAAHAAGLVHRDIKPANIIVGDDGQVKVLDFGLAQVGVQREESGEAPAQQSASLDERLTHTGALLGTLAYMAPEQLGDGSADARSDQFSFCVSLFEALYGERPFSGATPSARLAAMRQGAIMEVPGKSSVPSWLRFVLVRGLAFAPEDRWPSMDALLAELARDPARLRRRWLSMGTLGVGVVALAATAIMGGLAAKDRRAALCTGARAQIEEVWNQEQRSAIEQTMLATGISYASDTWERTAVLLDRYATEWAAGHIDACEATAVREEQSQEVLDQRMQCLARRRRSLRALVTELRRIDASSVSKAIETARNLPLIASCTDTDYLGAQIEPPDDPAVASKVETLEAALTRAEQLEDLGKYDEGLAVAQATLDSAVVIGYPPIEGQARLRLGMLQLTKAAYQAAESNLRDAYFIARTSGDHETTLHAATQLVYLLCCHLPRHGEAHDWSRHVQAELPWVRSEAAQANSVNTLGAFAFMQGNHQEAADLFGRALAMWEQSLGREHPDVANALNNLGFVLHIQGKYAEAAAHHLRALALREQTIGTANPYRADSLNNLAGALYRQGKHSEAAEHWHRALAIREQSLGADHPLVADPLIGLTLIHLHGKRVPEALPLAERAFAIFEKHEVATASVAEARFVLARALMATGKDAQRALVLARQARELWRNTSSPSPLIDFTEVEAWLREHEPRQ